MRFTVVVGVLGLVTGSTGHQDKKPPPLRFFVVTRVTGFEAARTLLRWGKQSSLALVAAAITVGPERLMAGSALNREQGRGGGSRRVGGHVKSFLGDRTHSLPPPRLLGGSYRASAREM